MLAFGFDTYLSQSSRLESSAAESSSIFHGASPREVTYNAGKALAAALVVSLPALAAPAALAVLGRRLSLARDPAAWSVLATWMILYLGLYTLGHFGKPGTCSRTCRRST